MYQVLVDVVVTIRYVHLHSFKYGVNIIRTIIYFNIKRDSAWNFGIKLLCSFKTWV